MSASDELPSAATPAPRDAASSPLVLSSPPAPASGSTAAGSTDDASTIVNTRRFAHPPAAVFRAFADPALLARWWGPKGFRNTIERFEFRPGGRWHLVMHGPDGTDYANRSRFVEIVEPVRIVFEHEEPGHRYEMTMTFETQDAGTVLTWHMRFAEAAEVTKLGEFIHAANEQNFDRLAAVLQAENP